MIEYNIKKLDNENNNYDEYTLTLSNGRTINYYEALNNQFVNNIQLVLTSTHIIKKLEKNTIYIFLNDNYKNVDDYIKAFNIEFSNLKYEFIINNEKEQSLADRLKKTLELDARTITSNNYYKPIKRNTSVNQYQDYNEEDNPYLKKEDTTKIDKEKQTEFAEYNGYNERLIDDNVKNIVTFRKNNKTNL